MLHLYYKEGLVTTNGTEVRVENNSGVTTFVTQTSSIAHSNSVAYAIADGTETHVCVSGAEARDWVGGDCPAFQIDYVNGYVHLGNRSRKLEGQHPVALLAEMIIDEENMSSGREREDLAVLLAMRQFSVPVSAGTASAMGISARRYRAATRLARELGLVGEGHFGGAPVTAPGGIEGAIKALRE